MELQKNTEFSYSNIREDAGSILLGRFDCPEIYVDGVSQILLGYPMVKISMYSVMESGTKEIRKASATLAMDTPTAMEMAFNILDSCAKVEAALLKSASATNITRLKKLLDRLPSISQNTEDLKPLEEDQPSPKNAKDSEVTAVSRSTRKPQKKE